MNERKTENLTRNLLQQKGYYNGEFNVEEQKSNVDVIDNLLKQASKNQKGNYGYPEFIISKNGLTDTVMVIECKADINKHKSENLDKVIDYAVDGAIHYGKHLSKRFNVLSIGVSGTELDELEIDSYYFAKGSDKPIEIKTNNDILTWSEYALSNPVKVAQTRVSEKELMRFASDLHNQMRDNAKLSEAEKPMLVSAILIALNNKQFKKVYQTYEKSEKLATKLYDAVIEVLEDNEFPANKLKNIKQSFSFIDVHPELTRGSVLKELIMTIDENTAKFYDDKNYMHIDIIGKFYGEFLKYTGGDGKGLGIVLTPRHITEFFCDITNVNKDSIVVDTCQGTGGFLISSMSKMIEDAKGDKEKISEIKSKQLIGCEQQPHMYTLGVSNMVLRGDGKANIYMGSCFDMTDNLKIHKPNIGMINPPYSQKGKGLSELDFIEHMLGVVEHGGKVAAIVPISSALNKGINIRKRILEKHTLDAVFSMPEDLFYPVGTVTCIMVFNVGVPHPKGFETYFGYYKDDGFVKVRNEGRVDLHHKFENEIKDKWVNTYRNRKEIPGFSVTKEVTYKDEWVAEAYMETDYSDLTDEHFEREIRKYMAYLLENDLLDKGKGDLNA